MTAGENQLIVFCQDQKGIEKSLLFNIAFDISCDKAVFYADSVHEDDVWERGGCEQNLQKGLNAGERMLNAFKMGFKRRYSSIVLIHQDCKGLDVNLVEEAFHTLNYNDVVIGPTINSGYYLIGMNTLIPELFQHKEWEAENVLLDTLIDLKKLKCTFKLLKTLV